MDVYQMITDKICAEMEKGILPWQKPWKNIVAVSYATKKPYSILNQILLGKGGEWLTFNQVKEAGGRIRKGEKSSFVVFWKMQKIDKKETDKDGNEITVTKTIPLLRYYNVFHIDQCEDIKPHTDMTLNNGIGSNEDADEVFSSYFDREGISVHFGGNEAYYSPLTDSITIPLKEQFMDLSEYYSTTAHESIHSTGAENRLNRDIKNHFGDDLYSKEELVAELGAAYLLGNLGIDTNKTFKNSVAYIQSWKKHIKDDKYLFVSASTKAEKATKYILGTDTEEGE